MEKKERPVSFYFKPLYKISEVAEILQMNVNSVYELIKSKKLLALKIGDLKVRKIDLDEYLENEANEAKKQLQKV